MMLRATAVSCSSSCWIAAIWISFSRAIAFSGMVALSNTSESKSTPSFKSGFMTSTDTPKLLLPDVARNGTAYRFDLVGDLLSGARLGSFQQHFRHQMRDAVVLRIFSKKTAAKNSAHRHEWQARIFANQKTQSVR